MTNPANCGPEPVECEATYCGGSGTEDDEDCDGQDNNGDGQTDEGACGSGDDGGEGEGGGDPDLPGGGGGGDGPDDPTPPNPDDPCSNYRTDPVHVGTGAFTTHPLVDVRYAGAPFALSFVRHYTSRDGWPGPLVVTGSGPSGDPTRIGPGWFHTYSERLFAADARTDVVLPSTSSTLTVVHRNARGRGRRYTCPSAIATADFSCTSPGGTSSLEWDVSESAFVLASRRGGRTEFRDDGWLVRKETSRGFGWTVAYTGSSATDRIDYVTDDFGRELDFVWVTPTGGLDHLAELRDGGGTLLASFTHDFNGRYLIQADSAAGTESYAYTSISAPDGTTIELPYLESIVRDGDPVVTVAYDYSYDFTTTPWWTFDAGKGRVSSIVAPDGDYVFRYADDARNTCTYSTESTLIVDRSTDPTSGASCTDDASGDSYCAGLAGETAVCDAGVCRAATCQRYENTGSAVDWTKPVAIDGNCPCGSAEQYGWTTPVTGGARRLAWVLDDSGTYTTFGYDTSARLVAMCIGDSDTTVTTTATSCPSSGDWTSWTYGDSAWPHKPTVVTRRSAIQSSAFHSVTYTYNTYGQVTDRVEAGYSRTLSDTVTAQTLSESWSYDSTGRVTLYEGPAGEETTYDYGTTSGAGYGLLDTVSQVLDTTTSLDLEVTEYSPLGQPAELVLPTGAVEEHTFDFGGMRVATTKRVGRTTTYTYDAAGRLYQVSEGGRITQRLYDVRGRLERFRVLDWPTSVTYDETHYTYDDAGRLVEVEVSGPSGVVSAVSVRYDSQGYVVGREIAPNGETVYSRDAAGRGLVEQIERADADIETFVHDAFGRETEFRRHFGSTSGAYLSSYDQPSGAGRAFSRPTSVEDPNGIYRDYVYDDFGRLVRSESDDFGTYRWSYVDGRLMEVEYPNGERTEYGYDAIGRVTEIDHDADNPSNVGQDFVYHYDNDGTLACNVTSAAGCQWRVSRLAAVDIEIAPSTFWTIEYDYAEDGSVLAELWPGGNQTTYEQDTQGRLQRMHFPFGTGDMVRYDYDATLHDAVDPTELVSVTGELFTPGTTYIGWAEEMQHDPRGLLTRARLDDSGGAYDSVELDYRGDGMPSSWRVRRKFGSGTQYVSNRTYSYLTDGMVSGYSSTITADPARRFFYDDANRLLCASNSASSTKCPSPTNSAFVESYLYDGTGNRDADRDPSGLTTYTLNGNALSTATTPVTTVDYAYSAGTGGVRESESETSVFIREYFYDGIGRLRSVSLARPTGIIGQYDDHLITLLYDHKSRPIAIVDENVTKGTEGIEQLYYDRDDRLIARLITADTTSPGDIRQEMYVHIEPAIVGTLRLDWNGQTLANEQWLYDIRDPVGQPIARYEHTATTSTLLWTGNWTPYGELVAESGASERPPWGFLGQLELLGSEVDIWNGSNTEQLRPPLRLNQWRVYDPPVGQYLTPEPWVVYGLPYGSTETFAYSGHMPITMVDPDGLQPRDTYTNFCLRNPSNPACHPERGGGRNLCRGLECAGRGGNRPSPDQSGVRPRPRECDPPGRGGGRGRDGGGGGNSFWCILKCLPFQLYRPAWYPKCLADCAAGLPINPL